MAYCTLASCLRSSQSYLIVLLLPHAMAAIPITLPPSHLQGDTAGRLKSISPSSSFAHMPVPTLAVARQNCAVVRQRNKSLHTLDLQCCKGKDSLTHQGVRRLLQVCLFSYGQTGAGKTHTMSGSKAGEGRGIIPRAILKVLQSCCYMHISTNIAFPNHLRMLSCLYQPLRTCSQTADEHTCDPCHDAVCCFILDCAVHQHLQKTLKKVLGCPLALLKARAVACHAAMSADSGSSQQAGGVGLGVCHGGLLHRGVQRNPERPAG